MTFRSVFQNPVTYTYVYKIKIKSDCLSDTDILLEMDDFEGFTDCNKTDHSLTSNTSNTF